MIYVMGGGGEGHTLTVTSKDAVGGTVTLTHVSTSPVETKTGIIGADGNALFKNIKLGEWEVYITNTDGVKSPTETILIDNESVKVSFQKVYGIRKKVTDSGTVWERTDDAIGLNAASAFGATYTGTNDFDNIYPWSEIKRYDYKVTEEASQTDVLVTIPQFYFKRYRELDSDNVEWEYIKISKTDNPNKPGDFLLHPAFSHTILDDSKTNIISREQPYIQVGAYKTTNSGTNCITKQSCTVNQTRTWFRTKAQSKNAADPNFVWGLIDYSTRSAINMLLLVEFANSNLQSVIGRGRSGVSSQASTGGCDGLAYYTGVNATGVDNTGAQVCYRGIEDWWSNVWEWTDGLNLIDYQYYYSNTPQKYADGQADSYIATGCSAPPSSGNFVSQMSLMSGDKAGLFLPISISNGSSSTYWADGLWSNNGSRVCLCGGGWDSGLADGPFAVAVSLAASDYYTSNGARLLRIPKSS